MSHRVLVCGGRDYTDAYRIWSVLDHYNEQSGGFVCLIEGEARGVDTIAMGWALSRGVGLLAFPANWKRDGLSAGPIRNKQMIVEGKPTLVIAFPGGRGTADMMRQARSADVPVLEIPS